uniref:hypothetical protein n=1 Tax=Enterocloster clostridioformis TaxID=1531 RepID=UPI002670A80C|nr:hypothetical protein [Enterocloster clostridioformis]
MQVSTFYEKLNKVDGNIYVVEEEIHFTNGVYEAELQHDNINEATFAVFTGPKLTGTRLETYTLSTPSLAPWKRIVRVYADVPVAYISYETDGDTVEGDDINRVQAAVVETQKALNTEGARALSAEMELNGRIDTEVKRAEDAELTLRNDLTAEVTRAKAAEKTNADNLATESTRAKAAEKTLTNNLASEITRAKAAEKSIGDAVNTEKSRATAAEEAIRNTIGINKPNWDDKYTRNEVDNKLSALETAVDWKEAVSTYADLATTYPHPDDGWTVNVKDTNYTYRWSGTAWIAISANAIPKATQSVDGLLSKEDKTHYDDAYNKRHTHTNKSTLDKLTETLLSNWTDAYNKRHEHGNKTVLDKITQTLLDNWNAAYTHISNKSNPHGVTKSQVGLGSVPNVATNDQVPTFTQATTLDNLTSGEKLTVMLGKIAKAIEDFITHKADAVQHITATERTNWNDANNKKHSHSNKSILDTVTQAMLDKLDGIASGAEVNVQSDWSVTDTGSDAYIKNKPASMPANGGTASKLSNAIQISDYDTFVPSKVAAGAITPIMAGSSANSPWPNTTAGLLIQSNSQDSWHILIFRSCQGGWAYRSYYEESGKWSEWKIWSTFDGAYSSLTGKPSSFPPSSHTHTELAPTVTSSNTSSSSAGKFCKLATLKISRRYGYASRTYECIIGSHGSRDSDFRRLNLWFKQQNEFGKEPYVFLSVTANDTTIERVKFYTVVDELNAAYTQISLWVKIMTEYTSCMLFTMAKADDSDSVTYHNNSGFVATLPTTGTITGQVDCSGRHEHTKSQITDMPTKLSQFTNDSGYLTEADVDTSQNHTHANKAVLDDITRAMLEKLAGIAEGANKYVHPTTSGNKHIPSGGTSGQILRWSADGTAAWGADNSTIYSDMKGATASAAGVHGLVPAPAAGKQEQFLRGDGVWAAPPSASYTHPSSGVSAGTYRSVTVNAQGHVTAGMNPTTLAGYGITDAAAKNHNHDITYLKKGAVTWNDLKEV